MGGGGGAWWVATEVECVLHRDQRKGSPGLRAHKSFTCLDCFGRHAALHLHHRHPSSQIRANWVTWRGVTLRMKGESSHLHRACGDRRARWFHNPWGRVLERQGACSTTVLWLGPAFILHLHCWGVVLSSTRPNRLPCQQEGPSSRAANLGGCEPMEV